MGEIFHFNGGNEELLGWPNVTFLPYALSAQHWDTSQDKPAGRESNYGRPRRLVPGTFFLTDDRYPGAGQRKGMTRDRILEQSLSRTITSVHSDWLATEADITK